MFSFLTIYLFFGVIFISKQLLRSEWIEGSIFQSVIVFYDEWAINVDQQVQRKRASMIFFSNPIQNTPQISMCHMKENRKRERITVARGLYIVRANTIVRDTIGTILNTLKIIQRLFFCFVVVVVVVIGHISPAHFHAPCQVCFIVQTNFFLMVLYFM